MKIPAMITDNIQNGHTVIIGAGAAGLMAAGSICGQKVTVIERNEKPGKKLYITGKGRCNVTNACSVDEFFPNVVSNRKFLYSAVRGFTPNDTVALLEQCGVPTKVERGNRVFPLSDKSSDVIRALYHRAQKAGAEFLFDERVKKINRNKNGFSVCTNRAEYGCDNLIISTGGKSYPSTGSDGDGYEFAKTFGHSVIRPVPSLAAIKLKQDVSQLAGVTLKNIEARVETDGKIFKQFGEILFTHDGVSGPAALTLSAHINRIAAPMKLYIDLKPALDNDTLDKRITSDFSLNSNKQLKNSLDRLLPKAMIMPVLRQSELQTEKKVNILTRQERQKLLYTLKNLCYDISGLDSFSNAVVTAGGVDTKEIDPKTMESKLIKNLYFIGEVIDVDALTGGFNLQIAFSTAYAAAKAINGGV